MKDFRRRSWLLVMAFALWQEGWLRVCFGFVPLAKRRNGRVHHSPCTSRAMASRLARRPFVSERLHESATSVVLDKETECIDLPPQAVMKANRKKLVEERKYLLHHGQSVGMIRGTPAVGGVTVCRGWSDDATKAFVEAVESIGAFISTRSLSVFTFPFQNIRNKFSHGPFLNEQSE